MKTSQHFYLIRTDDKTILYQGTKQQCEELMADCYHNGAAGNLRILYGRKQLYNAGVY